jgi:arsenite methyltransferase
VCARVGFAAVREVSRSAPIAVHDAALAALLGRAVFHSVTYRLFKLGAGTGSGTGSGIGAADRAGDAAGDEDECYGQAAVYKGTLANHAHAYALDRDNVFETGRVRAATPVVWRLLESGSQCILLHLVLLCPLSL